MTEEDGSFIRGGGGVAFEPDGSERPLTEEEILEHLDHPEVDHKEDGTIWVYYRGQKIEITDRFDEDGYCYLELRDGTEILFARSKETVVWQPAQRNTYSRISLVRHRSRKWNMKKDQGSML